MSYGNKGGGYQKRSGGGSKYGSKKPYSSGDRERKQLHDATCSTCGNTCKVPFRPDGDRPILCSRCFENKNDNQYSGAERRFESRERKQSFDRKPMMNQSTRPDPQIAELKGELRTMHSKLDRIMQMLGDTKVVPEELSFDKKSVSPIKKAALKKKAKRDKKVLEVTEEVTEKPAKKVAKKNTKKVVTENISFEEEEVPKKVVKKPAAKKAIKKTVKKVVKKPTKKKVATKKK